MLWNKRNENKKWENIYCGFPMEYPLSLIIAGAIVDVLHIKFKPGSKRITIDS